MDIMMMVIILLVILVIAFAEPVPLVTDVLNVLPTDLKLHLLVLVKMVNMTVTTMDLVVNVILIVKLVEMLLTIV
jgi:hypothetical protein